MNERSTAAQMAPAPTGLKVVHPETMLERLKKINDTIALRAFEIFESNGRPLGQHSEHWHQAEAELLHPVHIQMEESDEALTLRAEVPGFEARDLEISVEPRRLTISGKRETSEELKKGKAIYTERCADELLRVIELPTEVNGAKATATLKSGVLELSLPKAAKTQLARVEN